MAKGKQTCKILKEIRKQIAEENDIELVVSECTYQGDCLGTCPKCEAEVRYLERELEKRQRLGKAAVFAGMTIGTAITAAACGPLMPTPNGMLVEPDTITATTDTIRNDSIDEPFLLEGDVLAPMPDCAEKAEDKKECKDIGQGITDGEGGKEEQEVLGFVPGEEMPCYNGGEVALFKFINENLVYPQEAIDAGVEGRVFVRFWINEDGSLSDFEVPRGIGYGCDEEAVRVIQSMPKWKPGMQRGKTVRVSYMIPVIFQLEDKHD